MKTACSNLLLPVLLGLLLCMPRTTVAQGRVIPLSEALRKVIKTYGAQFVYDEQLLKGKTTSYEVGKLPDTALEEVLKKLLYPHELVFLYVKPNYYTIVPKSQIGTATETTEKITEVVVSPTIITSISGVVRTSSGQPLESVSVTNNTSGKSTATNRAGSFIIAAQPGDMISFSLVSYLTYSCKAANIPAQGIILTESSSTLRDVVVTGYQTISKERSTGAYAKPNLDIVKNRSGSMNVLQRLDGLIPGLTVNNSPTSTQNPLLIRGLSTIGIQDPANSARYNATDRNPLFVVDGIAMEDLSSINPQDISDITVLKDATAASIWGSRASNGVIVIVTKRGSNNERLKVQYDGFLSLQGKPDLDYMPTLNSKQFIQAARDVFDSASYAISYPVSYPWVTTSGYLTPASSGVPPHERILYNRYRGLISADQANASLDSLANISNRDQIKDLWYRNASLMNHTISLSGGGRIYSFYGSLAFTDTRSSKPGESNNFYKAYLRQDFNLNKALQLYLITDLGATSISSKRSLNTDNRFYPYQLFKDGNGQSLSMPYMGILSDSLRTAFQNRSRINLDFNPLDEFNRGYTKEDGVNNRVIGGVSLKLLKGLKFEGVYGFIRNTNRTRKYDDAKSYLSRTELAQFTVAATPAATPVYYLPVNGGRYAVTNINSRNWTIRNQLVYDNAWNNREHQLTLLAGQEAQEQQTILNTSVVRGYNEMLQTYGSVDYLALSTNGVAAPVMPNSLNKSTMGNDQFRETETLGRFTSWYANAAYTFRRKYSVNTSWRIDQSNLFGLDKAAQNKPVWSVGTKWSVSEEDFMKDINWLNRLSLRATYGITGNSPRPGTAASRDILEAVKSGFLQDGVGVKIATPANARLTWESTKTFNAGIDFSLFDNRISGTADLYFKNTENLIGELPTNSFTGYASVIGNFGNMKNKGFEISLNSQNITTRDFSWSTLLTLGYNKNIVTQVNNVAPITTGLQKVQSRFFTGFDAFSVFAYQYAGLDTLGDPMIRLADKTVTKERGVAKPGDIVFMGTYQPKWSGGLSNMFSYKQFTLTLNAVYNLGHVMRKDVNRTYAGRLTHFNVLSGNDLTTGNLHAEFDQRWRKKGDEAFTNIPSYMPNSTASLNRRDVDYYRYADINVVDASFIKMRDITLAYSLPESVVSRIKAESLSFRVQVSNIMLWKANHDGIDPEFQDAYFGIRNMRFNQAGITVGAHLTF